MAVVRLDQLRRAAVAEYTARVKTAKTSQQKTTLDRQLKTRLAQVDKQINDEIFKIAEMIKFQAGPEKQRVFLERANSTDVEGRASVVAMASSAKFWQTWTGNENWKPVSRPAAAPRSAKEVGIVFMSLDVGKSNEKAKPLRSVGLKPVDLGELAKNARTTSAKRAAEKVAATAAADAPDLFATMLAQAQLLAGGPGPGGLDFTGGGPATPAKPLTDAELRQYVASNYGYLAAFLDMPEVGSILVSAAREGWDENRLRGALSGTTWWKKTSDSQRMFDAQERLDNASVVAAVDKKQAGIKEIVASTGITLGFDRTRTIARNAVRNGWDDFTTREALAAESEADPNALMQVRQGAAAQKAREIAGDFALKLGDDAINKWATSLAFGTDTVDNYRAEMARMAAQAYSNVAPMLAEGKSIREITEVYLQAASSMLGVNKSTIDLTDPKWQQLLSANAPAPTVATKTRTNATPVGPAPGDLPGQMPAPSTDPNAPAPTLPPAPLANITTGALPTLDQWMKTIRTDQRFGYGDTANGQREATSLTGAIRRQMGLA